MPAHEVKDHSFLTGFEYDGDTKKLLVSMTSGKKFQYDYVPQHTYDNLVAAESKGNFFTTVIKKKFKHKEL